MIHADARLVRIADTLSMLGGKVSAFESLRPQDINLEELEGDYSSFLHPLTLDQLLAEGLITGSSHAQLYALQRLIAGADADPNVRWQADAYCLGGYWYPVYVLARETWMNLHLGVAQKTFS